jgi:lysozyme
VTAIEKAANLCKEFEGFKAEEYICPAGVPTIGFGTTRDYPKGPITEEQATELLERDLEQACERVQRYAPDLTDNRLAAILSWVYNLGIGNFVNSTMLKKIRENDHEAAAQELLRWDKVNGKPMAGLTRRRKAEYDLYTRKD